jgi:hypothetical protein
MSAIGSIDIRVEFSDSTARQTKVLSKLLSIDEFSEFTSATVAVTSGTVGTASASVSIDPTDYRNASGEIVSFSTAPTLVGLKADGAVPVILNDDDLSEFSIASRSGSVAVTRWGSSLPGSGLRIQAVGGTNTYTILIVRES